MKITTRSTPKSGDSKTDTTPEESTESSEAPPESSKPVDVRDHAAVLESIRGGSQDQRGALMAEYHRVHTLPHLSRYRRPVIPERPASFPSSDDDLIDEAKKRRMSSGAHKDDRLWLEGLGIWRGGVLHAETEAEGHLIILLSAIMYFDIDGDDSTAFNLRRFVGNEYLVRVAEGVPANIIDARRLAMKWSRRYDVLSEQVRTERRLPRTSPARDDDPARIDQISFEDEYRGRK